MFAINIATYQTTQKEDKIMSTTHPIKTRKSLEKFKDYYISVHPNPRNYAMIVTGLNTAFRIGDLLKLQWKDVWNDNTENLRTHICIEEHKTGKSRIVPINKSVRNVLCEYHRISKLTAPTDYLFPSMRDKTHPLSRYQAYRIIRTAAIACNLNGHISCHSLRKTFGYHAWKQGTPPAMLMELYNHSSYGITKRYLGIEQDEKDKVYMMMDL